MSSDSLISSNDLATGIRWTARLWSIATLLILSAFIFGDGEPATPTAVEWIGLACFPGGVIAGLLIAWWRERLGGWITVLSLIGFYVWHFFTSGRLSTGPYFLLLSAPGFLFLIAAWLQKRGRTTDGTSSVSTQSPSLST
jgi:hypothetical protein